MGTSLFGRVRDIIEGARRSAARSVDTAQVVSNWLIGREIVQDQQKGSHRAAYGKRLLLLLSERLQSEFGRGYSFANLNLLRQFYSSYPYLVRRRKILYPVGREFTETGISCPAGSQSWRPGLLSPNLSWRHYRALIRVPGGTRVFYELEAVKNGWSGRELERQINSLLYERLALSKDKAGLMKLTTRGQEVRRPEDAFKDPVVIEFLGLPEAPRLSENNLEGALIGNLRQFLLELGKGFAFVARQERLSLDGDHFYVDLGLILCTDKNDAVVRYTLGRGRRKIFASRYKLYLPTEAELAAELRREVSAYKGAG